MKGNKNTTLIILAFFAIYVIWGSTYLLNKIAVAELAPFFLAGIRFFIAGSLILLLAVLTKKSIKISKKQLLNTVFLGFLFLSFGNGLAVWSLKFVDSNFAALVISAQPLVILFMMWLLQGKKMQPMSLFGVFLGMLGIYLLVSQKNTLEQDNIFVGVAMIFAAMLGWGYGSLFVAKADLPKNYFVNTGYQMFAAGILLFLFSFLFQEPWSLPTSWSTKVQWSILLLVIFGSIVAFTSFNFLLKVVSPEKVATNTYVNPIVAMFLGWYFLEEHISIQSIVAAVVLLTGVYFINTKKTLKILNRFKR